MMERHSIDPKACAYVIWEHYNNALIKGEFKTPEMKAVVIQNEEYWRDELLRLTEDEIPEIMSNAGLKSIDDDQKLSFHS